MESNYQLNGKINMKNCLDIQEPKDGIILIKGDSNKVVLDLIKSLGSHFADLILTDPPYGASLNDNNYFFSKEIPAFTIKQLRFITLNSIKDNGAILMFNEGDGYARIIYGLIDIFKYNYAIDTHKKRGHLNCNRRPMLQHALVGVFYKKPPFYNPQNNSPLLSEGIASDMIYQNKTGKRGIYPNERNVETLEHFIKTYTKEGELVFDFLYGFRELR